MNGDEFLKKVAGTFTVKQIVLIQFAIYFNPDKIFYYEDYHLGHYEKCFKYLMENAFELTLNDVPNKFSDIAQKMIKTNSL